MLHLFTIALITLGEHGTSANIDPYQPLVRPTHEQARDTIIQAGTYDLAITFGGGQLEATLEIAFVRDSLTAVLRVGGDHIAPVKPGARNGNKLKLEPSSAGMDVRYDLEFAGPKVSGTFIYLGDSGTVTGKRREGR